MYSKTKLKTARKLFRKGDFGLVVRLLEKEVFHFRNNPDYYLLLSLCYLKLNNPKTAQTYLESARALNPSSIEVSQAQAILDIMKGNSEKALSYWLDLLDQDPQNSLAQNGLDVLRIHSQKPITAWINSCDFASLYFLPSLKYTRQELKRSNFRPYAKGLNHTSFFSQTLLNFLKGFCLFLVLIFLGFGLIFGGNWLVQLVKRASMPKRAGIEVFSLSPKDELLASPSIHLSENKAVEAFRYHLNTQEVVKLFDMIKDSFNQYEDNTAQILINRLNLSNAGEEVKKKARSLSQFIVQPTFATFTNGPSYQEVSRDSLLYENVYVRWKGKITNLKENEQGFTFDLLVGYTDNKILQGIVACHMGFDTFLENGMNIELIAQVKEHDSLPPFYLRVTSLHNLHT